MVLRSPSLSAVLLALAAVAPTACLRFNETALERPRSDGGADEEAGSDTRPPATPDAARDLASPGDTSAPPDVTPTECTPRELGCTADGKPRSCTEQGSWTTGAACAAQTACSAGVCVCSGACADEPLFQTPAPGFVEDLAGGGTLLYMAVNGPQASIRRFDLAARKEMVLKAGEPGGTLFGLDSDGMGDLLWCSDVQMGGAHTGQLVHGTQQLDPGPCTHARRRDKLVYFKGDALYRRALDGTSNRETISSEPMETFEIAGNDLFFVDDANDEAVLRRLSLSDTSKVDTLARRPGTSFFRVMPDASHVYLIADGDILRVPRAGGPLETVWQQAGPDAWAMAQTDAHLYWSAVITGGSTGCTEAQILRRPKAGGPVTTLAQVPGYCAGQLVRIDNYLYTVVWTGPLSTAPAKVLRIRL